MSDLYIDGAMLARVRQNLAGIRHLLDRPRREIAKVDGWAVRGVRDLERRMNEFGHEWSYVIGKLADFSDSAVEALDTIEKTFTDAEKQLTDALNQARRK
jgi:hypothetical protein